MTVEIYRDAWGIPHLRADSALELARAQGRITAVDRAWQLEVERHRSQGTSAAFLGAEAVAWDRFARQARLDDTARRCFAALERRDPETAAWVVSYVDGVNEGLGDGLGAGGRRAPEFAESGLVPGRWEPWTPLGVWLATHILFAGFPAKLWREEVVRRLGVEAVGLFATDGTGTSGSNGWLVSGARTVTGHAVIGGDPHRFIEDPGVYQQIHLACPEFDVVGLAVPGVPGIAHFAHTGHVAWAITNAMADYQDLYRERLRVVGSSSSVEALGADGEWRVAARHVERVEVAGGESVEVEVIETERGPVVIGGAGEDEVISLRYPPRVSEDLGFSALLPLLRAREVADVDRAFDLWAEPVNVVQAADTAGGLLHRVAGRVPVRSERNRTRVVDAWEEGREWQGWHAMPRVGVSGIAVMANQRGLAEELGVEFAAPHRAARIRELLVSRAEWAASDIAAIHVDTHLASAAVLLGHLEGGGGQRLSPEGVRCGINCSPGIGGWMPAVSPLGCTRRFVALLCGGLRRSRRSPFLPSRLRIRRSFFPGSLSLRVSALPSKTFWGSRSCTASIAPRLSVLRSRRWPPAGRRVPGGTRTGSRPGGRSRGVPTTNLGSRVTTTACCAPRRCPG